MSLMCPAPDILVVCSNTNTFIGVVCRWDGQQEDMSWKGIELHAQNLLTILDAKVNLNGGPCIYDLLIMQRIFTY